MFFFNHPQSAPTSILDRSQAASPLAVPPIIEVVESQVEGLPETIPASNEELEIVMKNVPKAPAPRLSTQSSFASEKPVPTSPGDQSSVSLPSSYASGSSVICR